MLAWQVRLSPGKGPPGAAGPSEALVPGSGALRGDPTCIVGPSTHPCQPSLWSHADPCRCSVEGATLRAPDGMEILNLSLASS